MRMIALQLEEKPLKKENTEEAMVAAVQVGASTEVPLLQNRSKWGRNTK
jgi:hypothetical protein